MLFYRAGGPNVLPEEVSSVMVPQDFAYVPVWGQEAADMFVQHSKDRKVCMARY